MLKPAVMLIAPDDDQKNGWWKLFAGFLCLKCLSWVLEFKCFIC